LNLAGNLIRSVNNLVGLDALTELNLRRNQVWFVYNYPKYAFDSFVDFLCGRLRR